MGGEAHLLCVCVCVFVVFVCLKSGRERHLPGRKQGMGRGKDENEVRKGTGGGRLLFQSHAGKGMRGMGKGRG